MSSRKSTTPGAGRLERKADNFSIGCSAIGVIFRLARPILDRITLISND
jgi:hypothetical protein